MVVFLFFAKSVGRRKTSVANLKLVLGSGNIMFNGRRSEEFFLGQPKGLITIQRPLEVLPERNFDIEVKVRGGGLESQAEASQLALALALVFVQPEIRVQFNEYFFLTRDSRKKERRKYGLKKARKAPQYSKRLGKYLNIQSCLESK
jgi:small subunit ribosomal protein S9